MPESRHVTITVSGDLVDDFEAQAHHLAPARIVRKDPTGYDVAYTLDWPGAPERAASVTPLWCASHLGDYVTQGLHSLEWYDAVGRPVPGSDPAALADHAAAH
ncbi:hypothetical protein KMT30_05435 [Streptomyces sp. IBSBF 2953]|nr:hypothetical protein [Streptomyces hayashii]